MTKTKIRKWIEEYIETLDDNEKYELYATEKGFFLPYKEELILFLEKKAKEPE